MNRPAPLTVRTPRREELLAALRAGELDAAPTPRSPDGVVVHGASVKAVARAAGAIPFQVQDEAAQLAALFAAGELRGRGGRVLDACAAPGGKTFHLAEMLGTGGEVVAVELHPRKAEELRREADRRGLSGRVRVVCADAARPVPGLEAGSFDAVLVDAPCAGLGTLRRKPDARWRLREGDPERFAAVQRELVERFARLVRPRGRLVYATCSIGRTENGEVAAAVASLGAFAPLPIERALGPELARALGATGHTLQLWPHVHGTDGFFLAAFERAGP
jgi:16S rRNA (cytosine967-C5)-methyltransferase